MKKYVLTLLGVVFLISCASEAEKEERQETAFDISGGYQSLATEGSEVEMIFEIKNESGRHNIMAIVERLGPLTEKETAVLANRVNVQNVYTHFFKEPLVLGEGYHETLPGGENISEDFGETSKFLVQSKPLKYVLESPDHYYEVKYILKGSFKKDVPTVTGDLTMEIKEITQAKDDGRILNTTSLEPVTLKYNSTAKKPFYKQYLGTWEGELEAKSATKRLLERDSLDLDLFKTVLVTEENELVSMKLPMTTFEFKGNKYDYVPTESQLESKDFRRSSSPEVKVLFKGPENKRILLIGHILNLGSFTGQLFYINGNTQEVLATFRHKKQ